MATLLNAVASDGAGTGASHTGPCTVIIHGDSVFDGAHVQIEVADTDTASDYSEIAFLRTKDESLVVDGKGTYFLRAKVSNAGSSTSITIKTTQ